VLLYYITDRTPLAGTEDERRERVVERIATAARCGIDLIQLREKDLPSRQLELLARAAVDDILKASSRSRLLINSRVDLALATGAHGVHLRSNDISPREAKTIWRRAGRNENPVIAVSCHTEEEVTLAKVNGADLVVFAPVFEKKDAPQPPSIRLDQLRSACRVGVPVLALGGVTIENAAACFEAGAAGIAGIRLFQEGYLPDRVQKLRRLAAHSQESATDA
jgi:thiamine-phosphate pyrophosphorylase